MLHAPVCRRNLQVVGQEKFTRFGVDSAALFLLEAGVELYPTLCTNTIRTVVMVIGKHLTCARAGLASFLRPPPPLEPPPTGVPSAARFIDLLALARLAGNKASGFNRLRDKHQRRLLLA